MQSQRLPRKFLKSIISPKLKCPICYEVYYKPRRLFCGHTFCKPCLQDLCSKEHYKDPEHVNMCPLCRVPIDLNSVGYDVLAKWIIDEFIVTCPVFKCPWKGECQLLETHYYFECKLKDNYKKFGKDSRADRFMDPNAIDKDQVMIQRNNDENHSGILSRSTGYGFPNKLEFPKLAFKRRMITVGTQTPPCKVVATDMKPPPLRKKKVAIVQNVETGPMILPMNGFVPVPLSLFKKRQQQKQKNANHLNGTVVQQQVLPTSEQAPITCRQQMRNIKGMYQSLGLNFYDDTNDPDRQSDDYLAKEPERAKVKPERNAARQPQGAQGSNNLIELQD